MKNKTKEPSKTPSKKKYLKFLASLFIVAIFFLFSGNVVYSQGTSTLATDALEPSDVENLKATAGDSEVQLTWDSATDNVGVVGYKIYRGTRSVKNSDERYDLPAIPVGNVKSYTVKNLTNGQTYYFTITAVDAVANESPNYALEVSATPKSGLRLASLEDDGKPPQVKEVQAEDVITVKVIFSEPVKLPTERPASAFQIEKAADRSRLAVQKAEIDSRDTKGVTVLLTTAPQEEGLEYIITAGIEVKDYFNNPIVSGTSDTGSFNGSKKKKPGPAINTITLPPPPPRDTESPALSAGSADFNNRIMLTFSENISLPANPMSKFIIYKKGTEQKLGIRNINLSVDGKTVYVTTDPQELGEYEIKIVGVKDLAGNEISESGNSITVTGKGSGVKDITAPEDVTKLTARIKDLEKYIVELRWQPSKNSAKDLADQLFYKSNDREGKAYGDGASIGTSTTSAEAQNLEPGNWYTFKITTKDKTGNQSKGSVKSIYLPETGPEVFAAGLTAFLMAWWRRKTNS